jgi:hypothetical protein
MMPNSRVLSDFDGPKRTFFGKIGYSWDSMDFFRYNYSIDSKDYIYLGYSNVILRKIFTGEKYISIDNFSNILMDRKKYIIMDIQKYTDKMLRMHSANNIIFD